MSSAALASRSSQIRLPILAAAATAFLCLILALTRPLFHDEASTIHFAGSSISHLADMIRQDIHPPLYFLISWVWMKILGDSVLALRLLSVLFMAGAVAVFVRALPLWIGRAASPFAVACIAIFPFFALCGYFARYYSLTCLLWACCFWAGGSAWRTSSLKSCIVLGFLLAAQYLTNYVAAALTVCSFLPLFAWLVIRRLWRPLATCALPGLIIFAGWLPVLWGQLSQDLPDRVGDGSGLSILQLVKSAGFLGWTLTVSDGLPPWNPVGLVLVPVVLALTAYHLVRAVMSSRSAPLPDSPVTCRMLIIMSVVPLAAAGIVGWVLLPGPMYTFLPPRVAVCGFSFLIVTVILPDLISRFRRYVLGAVLAVNVIATGFLLSGGYTNWAYVVPAQNIAGLVLEMSQAAPAPTLIYLPEKSMRNVKHYIERSKVTPDAASSPTIVLLPREGAPVADASFLIVVRQSRSPEWPPAAAVHDETLASPPGQWHRVQAVPFLQEKQGASRLKVVISGRDVNPDKIRVELWQKSTQD